MYVHIHPDFRDSPAAQEAAALTSACVHCGFCLATCPTYLDNRDERDSPRGRIYLIKSLLENASGEHAVETHLDRCLTCRSCETTCPSGVEYARIADAGRSLISHRDGRSPPQRALRWLLRQVVPRPAVFTPLLRIGQGLRGALPSTLRQHVPPRQRRLPAPTRRLPRRMVLLQGCVQRAATPPTNDAARRVFDQLGIELVTATGEDCCGAVNHHLGAHNAALADMRRTIDALWPHLENGAEAIISSATGCGVQMADYGRLLADDPAYRDKAARVSELSLDIAEALLLEDVDALPITACTDAVAVHMPCSQQHGLGRPDTVQRIMAQCGYRLTATREDHLCCGSAGTYSLLQPATSARLRARKLAALTLERPQTIVTANVGCQLHLGAAADVPVVHWIECLARDLPGEPQGARTEAVTDTP
ncbi:MAG: glycolate oxidase subunit GlcF [Chromatocurvus sp.]